MTADLIERLKSVEDNPYQTMRYMNDLAELAGEAAAEIVSLRNKELQQDAEIVRLRGEVPYDRELIAEMLEALERLVDASSPETTGWSEAVEAIRRATQPLPPPNEE